MTILVIRCRISLLLALASATLASPACSQEAKPAAEPEFFLEVLPPSGVSAISLIPQVLQSAQRVDKIRMQQVIRETSLPNTADGPIQVCFWDGAPELRQSVVTYARAWELQDTSVKFDFGDQTRPRSCETPDFSTIRISFQAAGTWSIVGVEARLTSGPTMNFDGGKDWSSVGKAEFRRIVQHEFGHALGLYHEHQHPEAKCVQEINWDEAYALFSGDRYNLTDDEIRRNFEGLLTDHATTTYDDKSIMLYDLPRKIFRDELFADGARPSCYRESRVYELSDGDKKAIRKYYPTDREALLKIRRDAFERYRTFVVALPEASSALAIGAALFPFDNADTAKPYIDIGRKLLKEEGRPAERIRP